MGNGGEAGLQRFEDADSEPAQALEDLIYESSVMTWMAGQLFVRDVEIPAEVAKAKFSVQVGPVDSFLGLPFQEAIDLFTARDILPPGKAFNALGQLRENAFSARLLATQRIRESAAKELQRIMNEGGTANDFAEAIRAQEITLGIAPSRHGYLKTVFETNVASAYGAGKSEQHSHPAVVAVLPYRLYSAVIDSRTRPEHAALDGKIWDARITDEWRKFQGPLGFNCRCSLIAMADLDPSDAAGLARPATHPDPAFATAPGGI